MAIWYDPRTWFNSNTKADKLRDYEGAGRGRRFENWTTAAKSANSEIGVAGALLRQRSRDLVRNNAYAAAAIRALTSNIVGEGIRPQANTGNEDLDKLVDDLWRKWEPKAAGMIPIGFYGLQSLAVRSWLESGEVLVRRRVRRIGDGLAIPLQLQIIEADQLDPAKNETLPNGGRIVQGVELDPIERVAAYHIFKAHPGETVGALLDASRTTSRIMSNSVAHLYEPQRPGQLRGVPWLTPAIRRFRDLDDYEDAELVRKKVEACVAAFVTSDEPDEEGIAAKVEDADGNPIETLEPGLIGYLRGGKNVVFNTPSAVGGYDAYKRAELQSIAAAVGLTYELLSGDLSRVNFSSIRAGLIEFRRVIRSVRSRFVIPLLCDPVWNWFIEAGIAAGELPAPINGSIAEVYGVKWTANQFEEVDRVKEANADLLELRAGTSTLAEVITRRGKDWQETLAEHSRVMETLDELGLVFDADPRRTSKAGTAQDYLRERGDVGVLTEEEDAPVDEDFANDEADEEDEIAEAV